MAYTKKSASKTKISESKPKISEPKPKVSTTKPKTTRTSKKLEPDPIEVETPVKVEEEKVVIPEKKKFEPSSPIRCRSVTQGQLFMEGIATKITYHWVSYDDVIDVEYRDLVAAVRSTSSYLFKPFIVVEDEDFIAEHSALKKFYDDKLTIRDFGEILSMSEAEMRETIMGLPVGAREQVKQMATAKIASGELDSVKTIKMLEGVFDVDFNLLVDLAR